MHSSRDGQPCHVEIARRWQGPVFADGGDDQEPLAGKVQDLLTEHGFVEQKRAHYRWFELPSGLDEGEENARATAAYAALTQAGYRVALDPDLYVPASDTADVFPPDDRQKPTAD
ncbi:hypothetical protein [Streptomyces specialis]|uniref:hypothetical protein n=1 Tax=Streptomyces specialis TaxID=498367 RepID=UPI00073E5112|nr:hypothetical protein [Streptomyces specialis]